MVEEEDGREHHAHTRTHRHNSLTIAIKGLHRHWQIQRLRRIHWSPCSSPQLDVLVVSPGIFIVGAFPWSCLEMPPPATPFGRHYCRHFHVRSVHWRARFSTYSKLIRSLIHILDTFVPTELSYRSTCSLDGFSTAEHHNVGERYKRSRNLCRSVFKICVKKPTTLRIPQKNGKRAQRRRNFVVRKPKELKKLLRQKARHCALLYCF